MTTTIQILLGIALLVAGRKLFWLFVGAVGFVAGMTLANMFLATDSEILKLVIALIAGALGAGLALAMQNLAVGLAGFLAGGYGVLMLLNRTDWNLQFLQWVLVIVGGILGVILVAVLFEWALIILSSLTGATLLMQSIDLSRSWESVLMVVLFVIGLAIQAGVRQREHARVAQPAKVAAPAPKKQDS